MKNGFSGHFKYYLAASLLSPMASSFSLHSEDKKPQPPAEHNPQALKNPPDMSAFLRMRHSITKTTLSKSGSHIRT